VLLMFKLNFWDVVSVRTSSCVGVIRTLLMTALYACTTPDPTLTGDHISLSEPL
jgi:hypothetical protein